MSAETKLDRVRVVVQRWKDTIDQWPQFRDAIQDCIDEMERCLAAPDPAPSAVEESLPEPSEKCACWTDSDGDKHTEACTIHAPSVVEKVARALDRHRQWNGSLEQSKKFAARICAIVKGDGA